MIPRPQLPDENERLQDLRRLGIVGTEPEPNFDRIAKLAAALIRSPIALISLVDDSRQWFKARVGLDVTEIPRELAFCAHTIARPDPLIVLDTLEDERFRDNRLVTNGPGIRFYAGAPLKRPGGSAFGALCVMDPAPRAGFTSEETDILIELAGMVSEQVEQRFREARHENALRAAAERSTLGRLLHAALQTAQTRFIGGGESKEVFAGLFHETARLTASAGGCLIEVDPETGTLSPILEEDPCAFAEANEKAIASGTVISGENSIVLPCRHGRAIVGVMSLTGGNYSSLNEVLPELDPFLRGLGSLFDASRARRRGRKYAEAIRLRERALGSINSAVSILDPRRDVGAIIYCNSAFERMSGYSEEEAVGRDISILYGPETSPEAIGEVRRSVDSGSSLEILLRNYHRSGHAFWSRLRLSPVPDADGNVEFFVTVADDVTKEIEMQTELRRARDLAEANAEAKSRFVANISHEIRTPMNAVIGMTSLLLKTELTPEQTDFTETIRASGEGLLTIINEILDYSRIDSGHLQIESIEFDLRNCVESALDLIAAGASRKSLSVAYIVDPGLPGTLLGNVTRLRQVLINLLGNAVKFTASGSILLAVAGSRRDGNIWEIHFSVKDTGVGIPSDRFADIFKPFQQADISSTRRFGGTGLGLSIAKHLVELMGGEIWVESEVEKGSEFHFTITSQSVGIQSAGGVGVSHSDLNGKRAIVVDPNATTRAILLQHLEAWKLHVSAFGSLAEAEAAKSDDDFDVAILDNDMPDLSMQAVQRTSGTAPLLLLCSLRRRNQGLAAIAATFSDRRIRLHSKPIKPSHLCDALVSLFADQPVKIPVKDSPQPADLTFAERRPLRLLLVEDNAVNQKLALLFLARIGYRADTANNGLEALQSLTRQHYDVIFMDMHMPEMDGLEATRRIRLIDANRERPWIIALTANAMQEHRNLCLAAGMDDFISKPIQAGDLRRALLAVPERPTGPVCPESEGPVSPPESAVSTSDEESDAVDIPHYLKELMVEEPRTVSELIQMFLTDAASNLDSLEAAMLAADSKVAASILHTLKGSSIQMGAVSLARRCAQVEPCVLAGDIAECSAALPGIRRSLDHAADVFSALRPAGLEA